jgi:hypothetical protein
MAITPAWVRLRDTGRDEPQSVLHCKFLQYTTVPRYRIFFFGGLGAFRFRFSRFGFPPRGIRIVSAQLAARPARARAPRGRAGRRWRLAGEPRGGGHPRMAACASGAASGRDTCFMHGQGPGTSPVPLAAALGARLICGSAPRSSDLSRLWCVTRIIELATCDLASRARTIAVFSELGSTPGRSSGGRP